MNGWEGGFESAAADVPHRIANSLQRPEEAVDGDIAPGETKNGGQTDGRQKAEPKNMGLIPG